MIKYIPLGEFRPDAPRYGSEALDHAENLAPSFGGYRSIRQKATRSTNAAPASNRGINGAMAHIFLEETSEQTARPNGVEGTPSFFRSNSAFTQDDLEDLVDGVNPSDTQFVVAGGGETGQIEFKFPELNTPASTANWRVRIRYRIDDHATGTHSITYTLLDNATTLRGPITVVSSTDADSGGWVAYEDTFTGNLSWDLDDLRLVIDTVVDAPDEEYYPQSDDDNSGAWTDESGNTTGLFESIDESGSDNDADFIQSPNITGTGSQPEVTFVMQDVEDPLAYYENSFSPAPFVPRYRGRVNHDNVVATYRVLNGDGSVAREGDLDYTNSASFSNETRSVNMSAISDFSGMKLALGAKITAAWKNAEGNTGTAEPDLFRDFFPTSDDVAGSNTIYTGDYTDVDDTATDSDFIEMANTQAILPVGTQVAFNLQFGDFQYSGIDFGTILNVRWRKEPSAVASPQIRLSLTNGTSSFWTQDFIVSNTSFANQSISLNTSAVMSAVAAAGTSLYLQVESLNPTSDAYFRIAGVWLNHPEPARAYFSRCYFDVRGTARASVSWLEVEVPSSSTGYIDDKVTIYAGDESDLYAVDSTGFTDVSGTTYGSGSSLSRPWSMAQWGNDVIATNYVDPVQIRTNGTGNFADLITSTNQPRARFVAVVENQVWLAHLQDDGGTPDMVWWSGLDDASDFDPNFGTQSDFQRVRITPGQITGLVGGTYATVFKRQSIVRFDYVGLPEIYRRRVVSNGIGTPYPRSIVQVGEDIYFYTGSGFAVLSNGSSVRLIGDDALSRFVSDLDFSTYALRVQEESEDVFEDLAMFGAYDPNSRLIFWFYSGPSGFMFEDDTSPSTIRNVVYNDAIVYDTRTGRWGYMNMLRGKTQEQDAANTTAALNLFKPELSATSWTRGMGMFGWDNGTDHGQSSGMAQTYWQLDDQTVFPSEALSKVFTIEDGRDVTINRIRPVFTGIPEGSADPSLTVTLSAAQAVYLYQSIGN